MRRYKLLEHDKITLPTGEVLSRVEYIDGPFEGMVGGYIEKEANLPHNGSGGVHHDAMIYGDAMVVGGHVMNNAIVCDDARIYGDVRVSGNARICGFASLSGHAMVRNDAVVKGVVQDYASVSGNALVEGGVYLKTEVRGNATVAKDGWVYGGIIDGQAVVSTTVGGSMYISGNAYIVNEIDMCHIQRGTFAPAITVYKTLSEDGIEGLGCGINLFGELISCSIADAMAKVATRYDGELLERFIELGVISVATPEMALSYGFPLEGK